MMDCLLGVFFRLYAAVLSAPLCHDVRDHR